MDQLRRREMGCFWSLRYRGVQQQESGSEHLVEEEIKSNLSKEMCVHTFLDQGICGERNPEEKLLRSYQNTPVEMQPVRPTEQETSQCGSIKTFL